MSLLPVLADDEMPAASLERITIRWKRLRFHLIV